MTRLSFLLFGIFFCFSALANPIITLANGHRYDMQERLGSGNSGSVYSAVDLSTGNVVAIKVFPSQRVWEVESAVDLSHVVGTSAKGYLVNVRDKGVIQKIEGNSRIGSPVAAIVMEKLDGTLLDADAYRQFTLADHGQPLEIPESVFRQRVALLRKLGLNLLRLWSGLADQDSIHGDLKPANIGYAGDPAQIKLLDFQTLRHGTFTNESPITEMVWNDPYRAPEQAWFVQRRLPAGQFYNTYADLYSFGRILDVMICNQCQWDRMSILSYWRGRLKDTPENQSALANLQFVIDLISATQHEKPSQRFEALQAGPFKELVHFEKRGSSPNYTSFYPKITGTEAAVDRWYLSGSVQSGEGKAADDLIPRKCDYGRLN